MENHCDASKRLAENYVKCQKKQVQACEVKDWLNNKLVQSPVGVAPAELDWAECCGLVATQAGVRAMMVVV